MIPVQPDGSVGYRHWTDGSDHDPVPRPYDAESSTCDFCEGPEPKVVLFSAPMADLVATERRTAAIHLPDDDGAWKACQHCFEDIEAGRFEAILDRAISHFEDEEEARIARIKETTEHLHAEFRARYQGRCLPLDVA